MRRRALLALAAPALLAAGAVAPKLPPAPATAVQGRFVLPDRPVWAGEVFPLRLDWQVDWAAFRNLDGDLRWKADPLVTEGWGSPALDHPAAAGGLDRATLHLVTRAMALAPGRIALAAVEQPMAIVTGGYVTDGVSIATTGSVLARSAAATLVVRPLPAPPPGFAGAVGQFTLRSTVDKASVTGGAPIRWTLTLAGTGNWQGFSGLPPRQLDRAFDLAGKPQVKEAKDPALFERTVGETLTIVPHQAGRFALGPVELVAFDPVQGAYVTVRAPAVEVEVRPGAGLRRPRDEVEPPAAKEAEPLPRLLAGEGHARVPLGAGAFRLALALPLVALAGLWLALAFAQALRADPDRQARAARRRLARILARLAATDGESERRALVKAWQRDAGVEWQLDRATPTPDAFAEPGWRRAWTEADTYLYGPAARLPDDWLDRVRTLHRDKPPPAAFGPRAVLARRHLLPLAAVACLLLAAQPGPLPATARAEPLEQWVAHHPLDWIARYDLARRAAIARRWEAAAVGAGIASVQQPRDPAVRALWRRAAREAGIGGSGDGGLPQREGAIGSLAALAAPAEWQALAIAGVLALAGGGALVLLVRFGRVRAVGRAVGLGLLGVGAIGGGAAAAALGTYGIAASPDAWLTWHETPLRPLPIDTPDDEVPVRLGPGLLATADARFLGWRHVRLGDGRAGWLREDQLLPLWHAAPETISLTPTSARKGQP